MGLEVGVGVVWKNIIGGRVVGRVDKKMGRLESAVSFARV